jgi:hypothetical protein
LNNRFSREEFRTKQLSARRRGTRLRKARGVRAQRWRASWRLTARGGRRAAERRRRRGGAGAQQGIGHPSARASLAPRFWACMRAPIWVHRSWLIYTASATLACSLMHARSQRAAAASCRDAPRRHARLAYAHSTSGSLPLPSAAHSHLRQLSKPPACTQPRQRQHASCAAARAPKRSA